MFSPGFYVNLLYLSTINTPTPHFGYFLFIITCWFIFRSCILIYRRIFSSSWREKIKVRKNFEDARCKREDRYVCQELDKGVDNASKEAKPRTLPALLHLQFSLLFPPASTATRRAGQTYNSNINNYSNQGYNFLHLLHKFQEVLLPILVTRASHCHYHHIWYLRLWHRKWRCFH